jgi:hypothetical protein
VGEILFPLVKVTIFEQTAKTECWSTQKSWSLKIFLFWLPNEMTGWWRQINKLGYTILEDF